MSSEFFVTLPSNIDQFPNNTTANFRVRLPQKIALDGDWEVALVEIMYPHSWNNVNGQPQQEREELTQSMFPNSFYVYVHDVLWVHCVVEPMYYGDTKKLIAAMRTGLMHGMKHAKDSLVRGGMERNTFYEREISKLERNIQQLHRKESKTFATMMKNRTKGDEEKMKLLKEYYAQKDADLKRAIDIRRNQLEEWKRKMTALDKSDGLPLVDEVQFRYDKIQHRVHIDFDTDVVTAIRLSPSLAYTLGYSNGMFDAWLRDRENKANGPPDLNAGFYALYVYCDLAENRIVGQYRVPLLRTVHLEGKHGDVCEKIFHSPHYIPVACKEFDCIEIDIKNDQNQSVVFTFGKVIVNLHFRKRRAFVL